LSDTLAASPAVHRSTPTFRQELRDTTRLATPLALAQIGTMLMGVVDTAVVSRFSAAHAAGASLGNSVAMGLLVFGMGLAIALEPLIAQAHGAGERDRAWGWWRTGLRVSLISAIPLSFAAIALTMLAHHVGISEETRDIAVDYLIARTPGNLLFLVFMAAKSFLQSYQRSRPLLVAAIVANVFNLVADVLLVDGVVQWGAVGAGLATSVSTIVLVLIAVGAIGKSRPADTSRIPPGDTRLLLKLGLPLGIQLAAEFLVFSTCGVIATALGDIEGNAHQIALHCTSLTFMAALGISGATAARVGEAVGLSRPDLVRQRSRAGFVLTMAVMGCSALLFALFASPIVGLFSPKEAAVFTLAAELLGIGALFQFFDGTQVLVSGALRGVGDIRFPFIVTTLGYWAVGFPVALGLTYGLDMGAHGLWYGLTAGLFAASVGLGWRYLAIERHGVDRLEPAKHP